MAILEMRRSDGSSFGVANPDDNRIIYPKTKVAAIVDLLDENGKIKLGYMSGALLGAHKNIGAIVEQVNIEASDLFTQILVNAVEIGVQVVPGIVSAEDAHRDLKNTLIGRFFQVQKSLPIPYTYLNLNPLTNAVAKTKQEYIDFYNSSIFDFNYSFVFDGDDGGGDATVENGDFVVFNDLEYNTPIIDKDLILTNYTNVYDGTTSESAEFIPGYIGTVDVRVELNSLKYINSANRRLTYGAINVYISGNMSGGYPQGVLVLKIGDSTISSNATIVDDGAFWHLSCTFVNTEISFTTEQWQAFYTEAVNPAEIIVHFGVVNNTYANATETMAGIVKLATLAEVEIETPEGSTKAVTPAGARHAVDTFGLKVADIPSASETVKGLIQLATLDEITEGTNISKAVNPRRVKDAIEIHGLKLANEMESIDGYENSKAVSPDNARKMIDFWGSLTSFATLGDANASPMAGIIGKIVLIG